MKPIIIKTKWLKKLTGIRGITLFPFIIYSPYKPFNESLIVHTDLMNNIVENHEKIHIAQAKELWVIGFYVLYVYYYLRNRIKNKHNLAYRFIPFEWEAYTYETDLNYLENREKFVWRKFDFN